ncbi:MAG: FtsX-like permease family protein [Hyphomicrobiales bacterium]|nr:FtsX-like permease family protein [Hyphomicrobiales bacterium]MCP5370316.1 FtsX-like permease family protein [Hyphomicrobiales bacterium]
MSRGGGLPLAWRLALRDLRGGLGGFGVFIACLVIGVAAIAAVGTVSGAVVGGLNADARKLLGGDVDLRLVHRPAEDDQLAHLRRTAGALSSVVEMRAMARPDPATDRRSLVELKAVDGAYPLTGALELEGGGDLAAALEKRDGLWGAAAQPALLAKLGVTVGDVLRVGEARFQVRAVIRHEPDWVASVFTLGPRLMIAEGALADTKLVQPGSQVRYHYRLTMAPGVDAGDWTRDLRDAFPKAGWRVRGVDESAPGVRRFVERMTLFLSFVGLTALLVGGIGIGNAVKTYLDGRTATIATLKCVGAPSGLVFRVYLLQITLIALGGIAVGLAIGATAPLAVLAAIADLLPVRPRIAVEAAPLLTAAGFGLLAALTFSLWPLAQAREVPGAALFRREVVPPDARPRRSALALIALGGVLLAAMTVVTASDRYFAYWFVGGTVATLLALRGGAALVMALARRVKRPPGAEWRLALTNLYRRGTLTPNVFLSLGTGMAVLVAVTQIEQNLSNQVDRRLPEEAPAFFFLDVQPDQVADFDGTIAAFPQARDFQRVPSLRGRIVKINGVPVEEAEIAPESAWAVRGDRALTYATKMSEGSEIVAGKWWPPDYAGPPQISFDARVARGFGVGVGDTLTINVLGREITATIGSLREIDWRSLRFDFAIIFAPGVLEGAPHTHVAAVRAPPSAEDAMEKAVTDRFANVTVVRVREALQAAARILDGVGTAVRGTASITILAGILVLAGTVAAGRARRIYDSVVFKVLGATRWSVLKSFLLEYAVLGASTGAIAAAVGTATAWAVVRFLMRMQWSLPVTATALVIAACLSVTVVIGFLGTWRVLGHKAAPYLRNE